MILEKIKSEIKIAMKARQAGKLGLLRLVVGLSQQDGDQTDPTMEAIMRKMIKNINEVLKVAEDPSEIEDLKKEVITLEAFLPKSLSQEDILKMIKENDLDVVSGHEGKVIGLVMKTIKAKGLTVQGNDVKAVIMSIRE